MTLADTQCHVHSSAHPLKWLVLFNIFTQYSFSTISVWQANEMHKRIEYLTNAAILDYNPLYSLKLGFFYGGYLYGLCY